ncbi:hypothetical protein ACFL3T_02595 [Patescibacteria group bacterium]
MKKTKTKKFRLNKNILSLVVILASLIIGTLTVNAVADITTEVEFEEKECVWSDGEGTELYVTAGKTCVISGTGATAADDTGWTDYAIIVYPGGTLQIGDGTAAADLAADGKVLVMGTLQIGFGDVYDSTFATINSGNLEITGDSDATVTVPNNSGAANKISISGTVDIGDTTYYSTPATSTPLLDIHDNAGSALGFTTNYGHLIVEDNTTVDIASLELMDVSGGKSNTMIQNGSTINISSYAGTPATSLAIGRQASGGQALVEVFGILNVANYGIINDVSVIVGDQNSNSSLLIRDGGLVNIDSTTNGYIGDMPDNSIDVRSPDPYGLIVEGTLNTDMALYNNGGFVTVDSGLGTAILNVGSGTVDENYIQSSALYIANGDTMTIWGTADIDGIAYIAGNLEVKECTKIRNASGESFEVASTGVFQTNTDSVGCDLTNTEANDGLNVQGTDTAVSIFNNADVDVEDDFRVTDEGNVDSNGFMTINGNIYILNDGVVSFSDAGDAYTAIDLVVEPESSGAGDATLTIEGGGELQLSGAVKIGTTATSTGDATVIVNGTLTTAGSPNASDFKVGRYGTLDINGDAGQEGVVSHNAIGPGIFHIDGGVVIISGTSALNDGDLNITDQELQMDNDTSTAALTVQQYGAVNSTATPSSGLGFDYDDGILQIDYLGEATFDDTVDIDTTGNMYINGLLKGTDYVYIGCTGTTCKVGPSGEVEVVDSATDGSLITVERSFDLLGMLNGDGGAGDILIDDTNTPTVSSQGGATENSYAYMLAQNLDLEAGATIDVSNFQNCYVETGATYGGSYGGQGQGPAGPTTSTFGEIFAIFNPVYSGTPLPVGMCGFTSASEDVNKNGGGSIFIEVEKDITINGDILANGVNAVDGDTGAGSGGLIVIWHQAGHVDTDANFAGSGTIQANGGDGAVASSYAGGGGRIVIGSILFEDPDDENPGPGFPHYEFDGVVEAFGGSNFGAATYAASGTIVYFGDLNHDSPTLIVDQANRTIGGGAETELPLGSYKEFSRVEARKDAQITFNTPLTLAPVSCFQVGGGNVDENGLFTCSANPDKPDTLYINNSVAQAQTGDEPWTRTGTGGPGTSVDVADIDPVFSLIVRNPEDVSQEYTKVEFEVNSANDFAPGTMVWEFGDTNNPYTLDTPVNNGDRTEDIEYAGDPLSTGTTYYVRARFLNPNLGDAPGLWTHMDMGNEYKFTILSAYYDIENACSDVLTITQDGLGVDNVNIADGQRYGFGDCEFTINSTTNGNWQVQYGMAPGETDLSGTAYPLQTITPIDNAGGDYTISSAGIDDLEEYGFNIDLTTSGLTGSNVPADLEDAGEFFNTSSIFDIEANGSEDPILVDVSTAPVSDDFVLQVFLHVAEQTYADDYLLDTWMILTQGAP